ncbi:MAG: hypothetical protein IPH82_15540, partial [Chloroflexi bacterium]|nr:hypothetical protein [Chloroflexota bacterium]
AANLEPQPCAGAHTSQMLGARRLPLLAISEGGAHDPFNWALPAWQIFLAAKRPRGRYQLRACAPSAAPGKDWRHGHGQRQFRSGAASRHVGPGTQNVIITQDVVDLFDITVHALMDGTT